MRQQYDAPPCGAPSRSGRRAGRDLRSDLAGRAGLPRDIERHFAEALDGEAHPIARHGPFVMNTRAEIEETLRDLRSGHFIRGEPRDG